MAHKERMLMRKQEKHPIIIDSMCRVKIKGYCKFRREKREKKPNETMGSKLSLKRTDLVLNGARHYEGSLCQKEGKG